MKAASSYVNYRFLGSGATSGIGPMEMHNALLATGRFLALLASSLLQFSAKRLSVKVLPVEMPLRSTPVGIVTLKNRTPNPIAKLFIDCARTLARPLANLTTGAMSPQDRCEAVFLCAHRCVGAALTFAAT
jgi:DNA-binding transcriptional LysR family regulator